MNFKSNKLAWYLKGFLIIKTLWDIHFCTIHWTVGAIYLIGTHFTGQLTPPGKDFKPQPSGKSIPRYLCCLVKVGDLNSQDTS